MLRFKSMMEELDYLGVGGQWQSLVKQVEWMCVLVAQGQQMDSKPKDSNNWQPLMSQSNMQSRTRKQLQQLPQRRSMSIQLSSVSYTNLVRSARRVQN